MEAARLNPPPTPPPHTHTHFLHPRRPPRFATWNIWTMYEAGKAAQVAAEMSNYKVSLLGLCETRWTQDKWGYHEEKEEDASHTEGVALMLTKEAQWSLVSWEAVSSRVITTKFRAKMKNINIEVALLCSHPTNDADENFCNRLQSVLDNQREKNIKLLMVDFSARIGAGNSGYEHVMGKHGLGRMNKNGKLLANICVFNNMVISSSIFHHNDTHKATWQSPNHVTENQINHVYTWQKFRGSLQDVRRKRGADALSLSYHPLVMATCNLRQRRCAVQKNPRTHYNMDNQKDRGTADRFRLSLTNRFQALGELYEDSNTDLEAKWEHTEHASTYEEVVGRKTVQHKEWITPTTVQKIGIRKDRRSALNDSQTRAAEGAAQKEHSEAHREVKRCIRANKRGHIDNLARQAEEATVQRNLKGLYDITRKLTGR